MSSLPSNSSHHSIPLPHRICNDNRRPVDMQTWVSESANVMLLEPLMLMNASLMLMNASAKQNSVEAKCLAKRLEATLMEACDSMRLASQTRLCLECRKLNERNTVTRDDICPVGSSGRMSKQMRLALETNTVNLTIAIAASEWRTRFT